jgi:hypothetical protein
LHFFLNVYRAFLTDLNVYLTCLEALNVYLGGLLQYIFFCFFILYAMFCAINLSNIVLQRHCCFTGPCLLLASPLISYFLVVVVLVFLFVLLQFAHLGFCNLQLRLELRHFWWTSCWLLLCSLDVVYCCSIQLCRVRVLWLQLGLLVVLN